MQTTTPILNRPATAKPWYAQRWPWLLLLGPLAVVLAGSYTIWLAFAHQDALVVDDYYKQGKAINQDLRRDRIASRMGLQLDARYDAAAGVLYGAVSGLNASKREILSIRLVHSTMPAKDIKLRVQPDADGRFSAALPLLEIAQWQVLVENEQRDWRLNGRWAWPQQQSIAIKADPAISN
jgi:hypothetical protein